MKEMILRESPDLFLQKKPEEMPKCHIWGNSRGVSERLKKSSAQIPAEIADKSSGGILEEMVEQISEGSSEGLLKNTSGDTSGTGTTPERISR